MIHQMHTLYPPIRPFEDEDEAQFIHARTRDAIKLGQSFLVLGALFLFSFLLWDLYIDPEQALTSTLLRTFFAGAMLLVANQLGRVEQPFHYELMVTGGYLLSVIAVSLVLSILDQGLLLGLAGIAITFVGATVLALHTRSMIRMQLVAAPIALSILAIGADDRLTLHNALIFLIGSSIFSIMIAAFLEGGHRRSYRLEQALLRESRTDALTRCANRRAFNERLEGEIALASRFDHALSLLVFDLDHFKRINDQYGHDGGDATLIAVSAVVQQSLRASDLLARTGGEEFAIIMPMTPLNAAGDLAERLRKRIESLKIDSGEDTLRVSSSFGVAGWRNSFSADELIKRADNALYRAKESGRNRVAIDEQESGDPLLDTPLRLVWSNRYCSGEQQIDEEHESLFILANQLLAIAYSQKDNHVLITERLRQLINHIQLHFSNEEAILLASNYPNLKPHHATHQALLNRARTMEINWSRGEGSPNELFEFMTQELIVGHILRGDRDYFNHLIAWREGHLPVAAEEVSCGYESERSTSDRPSE